MRETVKFVVLGLVVREGPASAAELQERFIERFGIPPFEMNFEIAPILDELLLDRLVENVEDAASGRAGRGAPGSSYRATPTGEATLNEWLTSPLPSLELPVYEPMPPVRSAEDLAELRTAVEDHEQDCRVQLDEGDGERDLTELSWDEALRELYGRYQRKHLELQLEWVQAVRDEIERRVQTHGRL